MDDKPRKELVDALSIRYQDGKYSDLTIVCGETTYRVHKLVVCSRSAFFAKACDGPFQEAQTGVIDLPEDDPTAVRLMMHYLYHLDYPYIPLSGNVHDVGAIEILPAGVVRPDDFLYIPVFTKKKKVKKFKRVYRPREAPVPNESIEPVIDYQPEHPTELLLDSEFLPVPEEPIDPVVDHQPETPPELQPEQFPEPAPEPAFEPAPEPAPEPEPEHEPRLSSWNLVAESKPEPPSFFKSRETNLILHARVYAVAEKYTIEGLKDVALKKFEMELQTHWDTQDFLQATEVVYDSTLESVRGMRDVVVETFHVHNLLGQEGVKEYIKDFTDLVYDLLVYTQDHKQGCQNHRYCPSCGKYH